MNYRPAALAAGPVSLASLLLLIAAIATLGSGTDADLALDPLAIASSIASVAGLILLAFALLRLVHELDALKHGIGRLGAGIAFVGTMLAIGGAWSMVFVMTGLARMGGGAADAAAEGIPLVIVGYVLSFVTLAIGWLLIGIALVRGGEVPRGAAIFFIVGAVLCVAPLPARFFVIALAVTYLEARVLTRSAGELSRV